MSKFFTVVTAVDTISDFTMAGESFYSGEAKTADKSIDEALKNYKLGKLEETDSILAIRTYDDISAVSLKAVR